MTVAELKKIWKVEKNGTESYVILSWKGDSPVVEVPDCIGRFKVTEIGNCAFSPEAGVMNGSVRKTKLEEVRLPEGVTSIGISCFADCEGLRTVVLPMGLERIGQAAFSGCKALREIDLPSTVKSIGCRAFDQMQLSRLTIRRSTATRIGATSVFQSQFRVYPTIEELRVSNTKTCSSFVDAYGGWSRFERVLLHSSIPKQQREEYAEYCKELFERAAIDEHIDYEVKFGVWDD